MSLKHFSIFDGDDDDPMLSSINLVDVFLVLVVALMAAVNITTQSNPEASREIVMHEKDKEIRYQGTGSAGEGEGVRAGIAYRLRDGSIIYVPEGEAAPQSVSRP